MATSEALHDTPRPHSVQAACDAALPPFPFLCRHNTVVLGFHYTSMSEMVIKELPRYTWLSLGAEVGGIVGFLFGIGIVNVIAGVIKAIFLGKSYVRKVFT